MQRTGPRGYSGLHAACCSLVPQTHLKNPKVANHIPREENASTKLVLLCSSGVGVYKGATKSRLVAGTNFARGGCDPSTKTTEEYISSETPSDWP